MTIGGATVEKQSIGVATESPGFTDVDGILGVGPVGLTSGTVSGVKEVPTFMNNLYSTGAISTEALGVYFAPSTSEGDTNGELAFGGADSSKYTGALAYVPLTAISPYSEYWGIHVNSISYGPQILGITVGVPLPTEAIVDTGTTLIYLPPAIFRTFLTESGGRVDGDSGLPKFDTKPTLVPSHCLITLCCMLNYLHNYSGNLIFLIGRTTYKLTPDQYLVPQEQLSLFGLASGKFYAFIAEGSGE